MAYAGTTYSQPIVYTTSYSLPKMGKKGKEFWGEAEWIAFHSKAAVYDPKSRDSAKAYVYSLTDLLPCELCRKELLATLVAYPIDNYLSSHEDFFRFSWICHDRANKAHNSSHPGASKVSPPYEIVRNHYFAALRD